MLNTPFPPWPDFTDEEFEAVRDVLSSGAVNYWTGEQGKRFESEFSDFAETKYAISLANGTVALEIALQALDIGAGSEVIITPRTFLASASSIVNVGAKPVFADVDLESQNITPASVEPLVSSRTKAIICVHLAGWPCDVDEFLGLAQQHGIAIIEDCAQAHGARYRGRSVGSFGNIGAWSFCQDKIMTTGGEGGMVTTSDQSLWSSMWSLKDHGKSYEAVFEREHSPGFRWLHESFGTNARMTEMQAAIGRSQLLRMPQWHARRLQIANVIWSAARETPGIRAPFVPEHMEHAAYKCYVFVEPESLKSSWDRDRIMAEINALGVPCYSGSCSEVYLEKAFDGTGYRPAERLPNARELGETSLMFLCHPTLTDDNVAHTCDILARIMRRATIA
jgi:dTDP-4-amino-4,6-dideoxygalactose transaminase